MVFDPASIAPLGFGATFVLAIVASLFVAGVIYGGKALERAEQARDDAMKALAESQKDVAAQTAAINALTTELRESRLRGSR